MSNITDLEVESMERTIRDLTASAKALRKTNFRLTAAIVGINAITTDFIVDGEGVVVDVRG